MNIIIQEILQLIVIDNRVEVIKGYDNQPKDYKHNSECVNDIVPPKTSPTNLNRSCDDSTKPDEQPITVSQFELPDELLPSLNLESINSEIRIIIYPIVMTDTILLEIVSTPLPI